MSRDENYAEWIRQDMPKSEWRRYHNVHDTNDLSQYMTTVKKAGKQS
jgi:hypothetical protein